MSKKHDNRDHYFDDVANLDAGGIDLEKSKECIARSKDAYFKGLFASALGCGIIHALGNQYSPFYRSVNFRIRTFGAVSKKTFFVYASEC
jgi:hypothetical protein